MDYATIKTVHLCAAAVSWSLFTLRGVWMMRDSSLLQLRWVRIVPHVNDTLLLAAAIWMTMHIQQYPGTADWLTAKLIALLIYVALGWLALKPGRPRRVRVAAWFAAQAVFGYIVTVAVLRDPLLGLGSG